MDKHITELEDKIEQLTNKLKIMEEELERISKPIYEPSPSPYDLGGMKRYVNQHRIDYLFWK